MERAQQRPTPDGQAAGIIEHTRCTQMRLLTAYSSTGLLRIKVVVPHRYSYANRLETFDGWRGPLPADELASAGFIYRNKADSTQCAFCFITIDGWRAGHQIEVEHRHHSPGCSQHGYTGHPSHNLRYPLNSKLKREVTRYAKEIIAAMAARSESLFVNCRTIAIPSEPVAAVKSKLKVQVKKSSPSTAAARHEDIKLCKICYDQEMSVLFLPCAHLLCCPSCASKTSHCPLCRKNIDKSVPTFISFD